MSTSSALLREHLVEYAWRAWSCLGVAGWKHGSFAACVDIDALVLLTTMTGGYGSEYGTFVTPQISKLNEMIVAADADATNRRPDLPPIITGMTAQTIDLGVSGFSTFTPPP